MFQDVPFYVLGLIVLLVALLFADSIGTPAIERLKASLDIFSRDQFDLDETALQGPSVPDGLVARLNGDNAVVRYFATLHQEILYETIEVSSPHFSPQLIVMYVDGEPCYFGGLLSRVKVEDSSVSYNARSLRGLVKTRVELLQRMTARTVTS